MQGLESYLFEILLIAVAGGVGVILQRVWKLPALEEKLDNVTDDTDKNRRKIHTINNTLYSHETRITVLEKAKEKEDKSKTTS